MRCNNKYTTNWWSTHLKAMMEMRCNTHNATHGTTYTYVLSGEDAVQQQIHHYLVQHTPEGHDGDANTPYLKAIIEMHIHHYLVQHTPEGHDGDAMQEQIHHYLVQHTPEGHDGDAMQQQIHHNLVQHTPEGHDGDAMQGGLTVEQDDIPIL